MQLFFIAISLALVVVCPALPRGKIPADDEDADLTVPEIIAKYGYPVEEHFVTTSDGYILRMHRIPAATDPSKVVFLMHGILSSSADWIISGVEYALGYYLADAGYDVWMGNARGNHESRNHTDLNPDTDSDFWQFSWHEVGNVDVPTMIDYVLQATGQASLFHVGHSQGTTSFYVMTSTRPEYNSKVRAHFSLAPIAFMNHMTSPLMHIIAFWSGGIDLLASLIGINEFLPNNEFMQMVGDTVCADMGDLCSNALFVICGFSPEETNDSMYPVLMGHTPAGSSIKQIMHYAQEINSGYFRQYDFGLDNLAHYGSLTPPDYDLSVITTPIYLIFSHNDWLSAEEDVLRLCDGLGSTTCKEQILVGDGSFNHLDYMYGMRARELVYSIVLDLMNSL